MIHTPQDVLNYAQERGQHYAANEIWNSICHSEDGNPALYDPSEHFIKVVCDELVTLLNEHFGEKHEAV